MPPSTYQGRPMSDKIRILIADDQVIAREGIQRILEREQDIEIVGVVRTAPEVLPQVAEKAIRLVCFPCIGVRRRRISGRAHQDTNRRRY